MKNYLMITVSALIKIINNFPVNAVQKIAADIQEEKDKDGEKKKSLKKKK